MVIIPKDGIQSIKIASYRSFTLFNICFRTNSRLIAFTSCTSVPANPILEHIISIPSSVCWIKQFSGISSSLNTISISVVNVSLLLSQSRNPNPADTSDCGSASTTNTFLFIRANPTPRFAAHADFPVPPFWFTTDIIFAIFFITFL